MPTLKPDPTFYPSPSLAMEAPVVATDVGGTCELASHGVHGLIVPKHEVGHLRLAIETVLDDPAAARARAVAARTRIVDELSFGARTRRLEDIYMELSARHRGAEPGTLLSAGT